MKSLQILKTKLKNGEIKCSKLWLMLMTNWWVNTSTILQQSQKMRLEQHCARVQFPCSSIRCFVVLHLRIKAFKLCLMQFALTFQVLKTLLTLRESILRIRKKFCHAVRSSKTRCVLWHLKLQQIHTLVVCAIFVFIQVLFLPVHMFWILVPVRKNVFHVCSKCFPTNRILSMFSVAVISAQALVWKISIQVIHCVMKVTLSLLSQLNSRIL